MAITVTPVPEGRYKEGNKTVVIADLVFSGSYQDDGSTSTLLASDLKLNKMFHIGVQGGAARPR